MRIKGDYAILYCAAFLSYLKLFELAICIFRFSSLQQRFLLQFVYWYSQLLRYDILLCLIG
jgi:hypothetical protein